MVKKKTCVFISGSGSNLKSIINNSRDVNFPIKVSLILCNNSRAFGIKYAKKFKIPFKIITDEKNVFERKSLKFLRERNIKLICLAGFMKILSKNFIRNFKGNIINIHPSLLPKYKGLNTHKRVLDSKEKFTGCTVHFVNEKLDNGKIIIKKRVEIKKNETEKLLKHRVQKEEHKAYPMAIRKIFNNN